MNQFNQKKNGLITVNSVWFMLGFCPILKSMDNTVGSLTEDQDSLIIGSLLGDGYMSCKRNAYLKICHSIKQKKYVDWKYVFLSQFVHTKPHSYQGNGSRIGYRFLTRSLPVFTRYYRLFYDERKRKHIPDLPNLTPLALAIWYMDDGARNRKSAYFNTQQFSVEDQLKLLKLLKRSFGNEGNLNRDKKYWRIRLYQLDAQKLKDIIYPYMPSCMHYKIPL